MKQLLTLWPSVEKYVGNYITLECFALNKITCFNFGRGWRGRHCGRTFFLTGSSKECYSSGFEHSGFNTEQQDIYNSKQKVPKCSLGGDRGIRGAESKLGQLHMNKTYICAWGSAELKAESYKEKQLQGFAVAVLQLIAASSSVWKIKCILLRLSGSAPSYFLSLPFFFSLPACLKLPLSLLQQCCAELESDYALLPTSAEHVKGKVSVLPVTVAEPVKMGCWV